MAEGIALYLASRSPRRRELLRQIGVDFEVIDVEVDESAMAGETPEAFVARLALEKARAGRIAMPPDAALPVLGADTIVIVAGQVMGKPASREDGLDMLRRLSGNTHRVISAVALAGEREDVRSCSSSVTFRTLDDAECDAYWATGEPADKAGGYAIQGYAAAFISELSGSYSAVMGLPLFETYTLLRDFGVRLPAYTA